METKWKDVVGYEGLYQVSNKGDVKSIDRTIKQKSRWGTFFEKKYRGKLLKQSKDKDGYFVVNLSYKSVQHSKRVNRLVADAFIPNPENKPIVDHKNGKRYDNRVENLRWLTNKENCNTEMASVNKSKAMVGKLSGEKHPYFGKKRPKHSKMMSNPIIQINKDTGEKTEWESVKKCALKIGCSQAHLNNAVNGKNKEKGHEFKGCLWYKKDFYYTSINKSIIKTPKVIVQ